MKIYFTRTQKNTVFPIVSWLLYIRIMYCIRKKFCHYYDNLFLKQQARKTNDVIRIYHNYINTVII